MPRRLHLQRRFATDGELILTGHIDGTARLWDAASGRETRRFHGSDCAITSVAFAPEGDCILTGSSDGIARIWDASSGACLFIRMQCRDAWLQLNEAGEVLRMSPKGWKYIQGPSPDLCPDLPEIIPDA